MSEHTVFECDVTGERFGARNDIWEIPVRRRDPNAPFEIEMRDVHVSFDALDQPMPTRIDYVAVEAGEVIGVKIDGEYLYRNEWPFDTYGPFFEWFELEVLA